MGLQIPFLLSHIEAVHMWAQGTWGFGRCLEMTVFPSFSLDIPCSIFYLFDLNMTQSLGKRKKVRGGTRALHHFTRVFTVPLVPEAVEAWSVCPLNTHAGFGWDRVTFLHSSSTISICCDYVTILAATKGVGNWKCFWAFPVLSISMMCVCCKLPDPNVNNSFQSLPYAQKFII